MNVENDEEWKMLKKKCQDILEKKKQELGDVEGKSEEDDDNNNKEGDNEDDDDDN